MPSIWKRIIPIKENRIATAECWLCATLAYRIYILRFSGAGAKLSRCAKDARGHHRKPYTTNTNNNNTNITYNTTLWIQSRYGNMSASTHLNDWSSSNGLCVYTRTFRTVRGVYSRMSMCVRVSPMFNRSDAIKHDLIDYRQSSVYAPTVYLISRVTHTLHFDSMMRIALHGHTHTVEWLRIDRTICVADLWRRTLANVLIYKPFTQGLHL